MALAAIVRAASPNKHLLLMAHTPAVGHSALRYGGGGVIDFYCQ
jgi:hypothetical protein